MQGTGSASEITFEGKTFATEMRQSTLLERITELQRNVAELQEAMRRLQLEVADLGQFIGLPTNP